MSTMKTLIIRPADVSLNPLGAGSSVADARVSVVYDRDVWVDGQPVPRVPLVSTSIPAGGLRVPVLASDDPSITEGAGFVIKVIVETTPRIGPHNDSGTSLARTIQVVTADPDEIPLGSRPNLTAVPDPAQYADVMSAIMDAADAKAATARSEDAATLSASSAAASQSDAAVALDKVNQAVASQDSATAQNIATGPLTREKLASITLGVSVDSFRLSKSSDGDQSQQLNAFLADPSLSGVRRIVGTAQVASTVTVPAGVAVDMRQGVMQQLTDNTTALTLAGGARVEGGRFVGKATDMVSGTGSHTPSSIGVRVAGAGAARTFIEGVTVEGFPCGIYADRAPYLTIEGAMLFGPDGINGVSVPKDDGWNVAVYLNAQCADATVRDLRMEGWGVGFTSSMDADRLTLSGLRIRNIKGQHGVYLENATGLLVDDVQGDTVALNLVKLQFGATTPADGLAPVLTNISGTSIGDAVLMVTQTSTNLLTAKKFQAAAISNIAGANCGRVLYAASIQGGTITGVSGFNTANAMFTLVDVQDVTASGITSRRSGKQGIMVGQAAGSATSRVTIKGARIHNPGDAGIAGTTYGVYVAPEAAASSITIDDVHTSADNGKMQYGVYVVTGDTSTLRVRNCASRGHTARAFQLPAGTTTVGEWSNNDATDGKTTLNFPTGSAVRSGSAGDRTRYSCAGAPTAGVFVAGDIIDNSAPTPGGVPTWYCTASGGAYSSTWAASTAYTAGTQVRTSAGKTLLCTAAGTSGASEPSLPPAIGQTIADGGVTWQWKSSSLAVFKAAASVAA